MSKPTHPSPEEITRQCDHPVTNYGSLSYAVERKLFRSLYEQIQELRERVEELEKKIQS